MSVESVVSKCLNVEARHSGVEMQISATWCVNSIDHDGEVVLGVM